MNSQNITTPALILDTDKVKANIEKMNKHINRLGAPVRPHGKTAKNSEIMKWAVEGQKGGITVSTLREGEYYFEKGFKDLIYAVGISPGKIDRVISLQKKGADIAVVLDSLAQAGIVDQAGKAAGVAIPCLIEIDSDGHRSGVDPEDNLVVEIGAALGRGEGTDLRGVLTHAGESYNCKTPLEIETMAERERAAAVSCAETLRTAGLKCDVVSIGSTPTASFAKDLTGVTEVRPGVYMFMDLVMAGLGVCTYEEIALSVLTTVIGRQKEKNWIITDSGWMALSRDRGTSSQKLDQGYGLVCTAEGEVLDDLIVSSVNQEHGIISRRDSSSFDLDDFPVGTLLRILPNHACATAGMFEGYQIINGGILAGERERIRGW